MRRGALALLFCWAFCWSGCEDPEAAQPAASEAQLSKQGAAAPEREPPPPQKPEQPVRPAPGWTPISIENDTPLCVFADYQEHWKAKFPEEAKPQKLRAGKSIVIGAFAPWCVNEACDDRPSLQCSVDREGSSLIVRSRYWGDRKNGASCKDVVCRPITAGCESPELEAGKYTIVHGDETFELRIPSTLRIPCFDTAPRTPPQT